MTLYFSDKQKKTKHKTQWAALWVKLSDGDVKVKRWHWKKL